METDIEVTTIFIEIHKTELAVLNEIAAIMEVSMSTLIRAYILYGALDAKDNLVSSCKLISIAKFLEMNKPE